MDGDGSIQVNHESGKADSFRSNRAGRITRPGEHGSASSDGELRRLLNAIDTRLGSAGVLHNGSRG